MLPPLSPLSLPALPLDALNSVGKLTSNCALYFYYFKWAGSIYFIPSQFATVPLQSFRHPEPESSADMLEIPGKGRCYVYLAKYTYDPFSQSPNENPEAEVSLTAGDYVLVWGNMDEVQTSTFMPTSFIFVMSIDSTNFICLV